MFSSSPTFWEVARHFFIIHPSFTWSSQEAEPSWIFILHVFSFSSLCMPVHHLAFNKTLWSALIILYSILFMCVVHSSCLQNRVLFWVVRLLLPSSAAQRFRVYFVCWMRRQWISLNFMRKSGHFQFPQCCCAMVSSIEEWVEACFAVLTLWFALCAYFTLVWIGLEWNWVWTSLINLV